MKKNAVVTYIYPEAIRFLNSFYDNLQSQSFQDFDLIIFNDGVEPVLLDLEQERAISVYEMSGTITGIRIESFSILKRLDYDHFLFADIDDLMTSNRAGECFKSLSFSDLVCNDLNLMNEKGKVYEERIWESRLGNSYKFTYEFIKDKNIVGFGNTSINRKLLNYDLRCSSNPIVADWFIFYQIMRVSKCQALFVSGCQTNYRQHSQNEAGIRAISTDRLKYSKKVTEAHLNALSAIGIQDYLAPDVDINSLTLKKNYNVVPFWWEEIKIAYEQD